MINAVTAPGSEDAVSKRLIAGLLFAVLAIRLLAMAVYPVMDTTEARYAEISRLMIDSGDWVVPQFQPGVPFWGKPPLFAWLTAGSFKLLGLSEFAARLPHFLLGLASLWLVCRCQREFGPDRRPWLAMLILASTPLFFVSSGAVMTESGLLFSTTLAMTAFWLGTRPESASRQRTRWGLLFFAALGVGLLAKGPIAVVLTGLPVVTWMLAGRQWQRLLYLPWLPGLLLLAVVALPWYLAMERHSPGFFQYFIVGEHILRFIQPGWQGDLYGNAHSEAPGMIWLLWFQATALWGVLMAFITGRYALVCLRNRKWSAPGLSNWQRYLLCWMLAPMVFFSFSGNILWTYVITGLPAFALLMAGANSEQP